MISKNVVTDFWHWENIQRDREIFPPQTLKLLHFFTHNISENRHMKYMILLRFVVDEIHFRFQMDISAILWRKKREPLN